MSLERFEFLLLLGLAASVLGLNPAGAFLDGLEVHRVVLRGRCQGHSLLIHKLTVVAGVCTGVNRIHADLFQAPGHLRIRFLYQVPIIRTCELLLDQTGELFLIGAARM